MKDKVCKFGGTSLANREQVEKVIDIVMADDSRRYIVVSAPGKADGEDSKVTDLLINAADEYKSAKYSGSTESAIIDRFFQIYPESEVIKILAEDLEERIRHTGFLNYKDNVTAFGEYAMAKVFASTLKSKGIDARFFDPKDIDFKLNKAGKDAMPDPKCYAEMGKRLGRFSGRVAVIPGFYAYAGNMLWTLPRGGSDTSGAAIARAVNADVYENWSDIDGLTAANPKIVQNPKLISEITYREVRELAYLDFKLQLDSLVPLIGTGIPLRVLNTNNPKGEGTLVVENRIAVDGEIVGVAARKGFIPVNLYKMGMNSEKGFGKDVFVTLDELDIPYEHSPSGIDDLSLIIEEKYLRIPGVLNEFSRRFNERRGPVNVTAGDSLAFLAVAGEGMKREPAIASIRAQNALAKEGIYGKVVDISANHLSFFIGIKPERADDAVRAVYREFFG